MSGPEVEWRLIRTLIATKKKSMLLRFNSNRTEKLFTRKALTERTSTDSLRREEERECACVRRREREKCQCKNKVTNRFLVFGKQTYTREAAAIVFKIFRSINLWKLHGQEGIKRALKFIHEEHLLMLTSLNNSLALHRIKPPYTSHTTEKNK